MTRIRYSTRRGLVTRILALLAGLYLATSTQAESSQLFIGFGDYLRPITTHSKLAQERFNQAIQLMYGFNHDEAIRSFHAAAKADPEAAMPWWGIAYSHGVNINDWVMNDERSKLAREAADNALARIANATPQEAALIRAVSARYTYPAPEERKHLDQAFADAMADAYRAFPADPEIGTLFADSLMNLQPWDYWDSDGNPKGRILEIVDALENTLTQYPNHPGANHFYIHAVEASDNPDRAISAADRLIDLVPGSGHLVHMPSHIYIRVGQYSRAVDTNYRAIEADRNYFKLAPQPGFYSLYYAHNQHMLAFSAMMSGRYEDAMKAARDLESEMPAESLKELAPILEGIMPTNFHVMVRFGKWQEILEEPAYPKDRFVSNAVRHYARSIAYSATCRTEAARQELESFEAAIELIPEDWYILNNSVGSVLPIAKAMIHGELLYREGEYDKAFAILREGIATEDKLVYDEPPGWMLPVRHSLGALLMEQGRVQDAEAVYREDLQRNRENGWALLGIQNALLAQERFLEAAGFSKRFEEAWREADTTPSSSCYCAPMFAVRQQGTPPNSTNSITNL